MNPATAAGSLQGPNPLFACAPDSLAEFSTLPPRSSSMVTTDDHRCGYCKGSPRACWVRGPSRAGSQPLLLGLFCHFFIAFCAATIYFTATRWVTILLEHAATSGFLYGVAVYFFMNRVVVPLSGAIKFPFSFKMMAIGIVIHIFCSGCPSRS